MFPQLVQELQPEVTNFRDTLAEHLGVISEGHDTACFDVLRKKVLQPESMSCEICPCSLGMTIQPMDRHDTVYVNDILLET